MGYGKKKNRKNALQVTKYPLDVHQHNTSGQFPLFPRYRDNSVHLHECSPFWVGIFITFNKEN